MMKARARLEQEHAEKLAKLSQTVRGGDLAPPHVCTHSLMCTRARQQVDVLFHNVECMQKKFFFEG
jgi:hypothetical protein